MIYPWQQTQWQKTIQRSRDSKLPHALLLSGPKGMGKAYFAAELSAAIMCQSPQDEGFACGVCSSCKRIQNNTHPDYVRIYPTPPEKSKARNPQKSIRIDIIRNCIDVLSRTSQLNGYRVVNIIDADRMIIAAANSLLKTLEEPGEQTLIIVTSSQPARLPVTIRSRCQRIDMPVPAEQLALQWLSDQGDSGKADIYLARAHGAPLLARQLMAEEGADADAQNDFYELLSKKKGNCPDLLSMAAKLSELPLDNTTAWYYDWIYDLIVYTSDQMSPLINESYRAAIATIIELVDLRQLYRLLDQVTEIRRNRIIAVNSQLLWEDLLLSWGASSKMQMGKN